ncbi:restriction endonuclease subunit S [Vreelandella alkaliphila]|uniref:Restriction endonuclease subunit S n=1 Tax=Vreelandella alkaliphila TaxID=272774 RepID=A0A7C9JWB6_9GAMM|nr:restriction endonuclease subunit S [Halomonas alkaliphila]NDL70298.1 restriction endonuclease subunit S [Halomonas alkaliphila]
MDERQALVPRLRFPEFREAGEWDISPLKKLANRRTERNRNGKLTRVLTNSAEHGVVDQRDYFDKDIATQGNLENYFIVEKDDFVYNPRISTFAPVGPISRNRVETGVMSPLYTVFQFKDSNTDFYAHYFKSSAWHMYMRQVGSTGARHDRMAISNEDFMAMPLPVPSPEEQQKIADCLSSLDALIAAQADKIDALKAHKKGLMQQLFPREGETLPRLRFPEFRGADEWGEVKLSTQIELISGMHLAPSEYTSSGDIPYFTGPSDYTNNSALVHKWTNKSANVARNGDTLVTVKGSGVGELLLLHLSEVAMGRQLMAVREKAAHGKFIYHILSMKRQQMMALASGNLIPGLSRGDILGLAISVPGIKEQQRIADCLSSLDALIAAHIEKLDALKTHKKGLMQKLFPSVESLV